MPSPTRMGRRAAVLAIEPAALDLSEQAQALGARKEPSPVRSPEGRLELLVGQCRR